MAKHIPDTGELYPESERETGSTYALLDAYERRIGKKLAEVSDNQAMTLPTGVLWFWSWMPDEAGMFISEIDSVSYLLNPTIRRLCFSTAPNGKEMMYEVFAVDPEMKKRMENVTKVYDEPIGSVPPVPKGNYEIDLRAGIPLGMRPTVYTVNHWHFSGRVKGISYEVYRNLAHMHGANITAGLALTVGTDNANADLGEIR